MRRVKVIIQGDGIATCLGQGEAIKRIKNMNITTLADQAYQGNGYVGFNLETGRIGEHTGPTTIKLYEMPKNNGSYLQDLRNHLWQNRQRLQKRDRGEIVFFLYSKLPNYLKEENNGTSNRGIRKAKSPIHMF